MLRDDGKDDGAASGGAVFATRDRAEAATVLRRACPRLAVEFGGDGPFDLRRSVVGDPRIRSTEIAVSGPARAAGAFDDGAVAVVEVLGGRVAVETGRIRLDPVGPFLRPRGPARLRSDDVHLRATVLDGAAFARAAARYGHEGALGPTRATPASATASAAWSWTAAHVQRTLRDPRSAGNAILVGELFDLSVRTLLACFADRTPGEPALDGSPRALHRAVAYLEDHALGAVAVPDVAAAARVSVRSLQALFRRHLGVSPIEHLHAIRLEAARRELTTADDDLSVRLVAERWGFGNSGRFARLYRERFGERPSETLRAHR